jgi:ABC-type multidrug transport system permease subunit
MNIFLALLHARNKEFLRDRGTLAWNFAFPFMVIIGLALVFSGPERDLYKVGLLRGDGPPPTAIEAFLATDYVGFVPVTALDDALEKVRRHQLDMVLDVRGEPHFWINSSNPRGYVLERVLQGAGRSEAIHKEVLTGREIRYIDWLLPGVLAMNMMFSCLFGVGYVIVRYRKGGILRRLRVTPVRAVHFLSAQVASRLLLVLFVTTVLFVGTDLILDFYVVGSLLDLFVVFALGGVCLISLGLVIAARTASQELAGGLLNLATWPMMFLSGVWFSLEGANPWLVRAAQLLPLTHMIDAARAVMVDGATLLDVWPQLALLTGLSVVFMGLGSVLFRWE